MVTKCNDGTCDGDTVYFIGSDEQWISCRSIIPGQHSAHDDRIIFYPVDEKNIIKDKVCEYCGSVNAPDARRCCGCQHAI